jgi:hypothetical protein
MFLEIDDSMSLKTIEKSELLGKILRPWFGHLSIAAFEGVYGMGLPDWEHCGKTVLQDICDSSTII